MVDPLEVAARLAPAMRWDDAIGVRVRSWRRVARADGFDAWLIAWPRGGRVELHDHGRSHGAISVISGTLVETSPCSDDSGALALCRRDIGAGTVLGFGPGHVHDVTNEAAQHALSLHVYSPALSAMTYYDLECDRLVAREVRWTADGSEDRATAEGSAWPLSV